MQAGSLATSRATVRGVAGRFFLRSRCTKGKQCPFLHEARVDMPTGMIAWRGSLFFWCTVKACVVFPGQSLTLYRMSLKWLFGFGFEARVLA